MIKNAIEKIKEIIKKGCYIEGLHWPNKEIEGWGVVKSLIESMEVNGEKIYHSPRAYKPDPPDCIAKDTDKNLVGFEVTALTDSSEAREHVKGNPVFRDWTPQEVIQEIQKKLDEKERKIFHGGPYSKKIIILHTHNWVIEQECITAIQEHSFEPLSQLNEAYLLLSYDPVIERYPYIKLKV